MPRPGRCGRLCRDGAAPERDAGGSSVIRPLWVEVQEFRGWRARRRLPLDRRLTVIVGENRCGKSSTLNAIEWCLFGAAVEKAASGLGERADWEVRPRGAGDSPTEVTLALATPEGEVWVRRRRPGKAKAGKGDELSVRRGDGTTLTGQAAEHWLAGQGLGDWETYRRAHCFHQEAARQRVLEKPDRSAILAGLLGLGEDRNLRDTLAGLKAGALVREVDAVLTELGADVQKALSRPRQQLVALEQRLLTQRGLERWQLGPALEAEVARRLLDRARRLADALGVSVTLPDVNPDSGASINAAATGTATATIATANASINAAATAMATINAAATATANELGAVLQWAGAWPGVVRASAGVLRDLPALRRRSGSLASAIELAAPTEAAWRTAEATLTAAVASGGDEALRAQGHQEAEAALAEAEAALKAAHALVALLRDAQSVLSARSVPVDRSVPADRPEPSAQSVLAAQSAPERCPVCESVVPDLPAHIDAALASQGSQTLKGLTEVRDQRRAARDEAERALQELRGIVRRRELAWSAWERQRKDLAQHLPTPLPVPVPTPTPTPPPTPVPQPLPADVLAAANAERARLAAEVRRLEQVESARDASLSDHDADRLLLKDLRDWALASQAAHTPVELDALPAWAELEKAVDEAAAYAADVECLEEVAREAQAERSAARVQEVNRTLGDYFAAITAGVGVGSSSVGPGSGTRTGSGPGTSGSTTRPGTGARGVQVHVHRTPKGLDYQLWDGSGEPAVPVMNQAAINALSLAALFAQAEDAAARGGLAWVVLDDPVQSLDEAHQQGLAEAVRRLSERCHVLVAAVPSPLVERLRTHVPVERRFLFLGPWQEESGSNVAREEVL